MATEPEPVEEREPRKPKARKKRQFARELAELQGRVDMAVRLLRKISPAETAAMMELTAIAIETLEGR